MGYNLNLGNRKNIIVQDATHPIDGEYTESLYSNNLQSIAIEVCNAATCDIQFEACMSDYDSATKQWLDDEDCVWTEMGLIDASDYSITNTIGKDGIYYVSLAGTRRFRLHVNNTTKTASITIQKVE